MSRRKAGQKLALHPKSIEGYETGKMTPAPDVVLAMARVYKKPHLPQCYCRLQCAIGANYSYEYLNNVDLAPHNILLKLLQEHREAGAAIDRMMATIINKRGINDFTDAERRSFEQDLQELQDVEHNIEMLKIQLANLNWFDIPKLVREHNSKCYRQGYVVSEYAKVG